MTTIFDVAKEAHVSKSTVSRVVNKDPAVNSETRKAVEAAIKKLHYAPSYFAKGIRTGETKTIALLVPEYANMFYGEMFNGVEDVAYPQGYMIIVCNTGYPVSEKEYIEKLLQRNIDGIIYNTYDVGADKAPFLEKIGKKMPIVLMDEALAKQSVLPAVYADGFESSRKAVHYLAETGCVRVGYVQNTDSISATEIRYLGYRKGLEECGLIFSPDLLYQCPMKKEKNYIKAGMEAGRYFAEMKDRPDAVMAAIDLLAIGCVSQLRKLGILIPDEISVIGYDNIELGEVSAPALTTISQPTREMGRVAAQLIIDQIQKKTAGKEKKTFEGRLIIRETTKQRL